MFVWHYTRHKQLVCYCAAHIRHMIPTINVSTVVAQGSLQFEVEANESLHLSFSCYTTNDTPAHGAVESVTPTYQMLLSVIHVCVAPSSPVCSSMLKTADD